MTGNAIVAIVSLPTTFSLTGGGIYCAGGTGMPVGLSGSQTGVNYQLKNDGSNVGSPVAGTGNAISFGLQTASGTYSVEAITTIASCTVTMSGSAHVTVAQSPNVFTVTGGGLFCVGGVGVVVGLSGSQPGVSYQLKKDGVNVGAAVVGTGSTLDFGLQTSLGTYTVEASKTTTSGARINVEMGVIPSVTCTATMSGSATVAHDLPTATITGAATVCKGASPVVLTFTGANGVGNYTFNYQINGGAVQSVSTIDKNTTATILQSTSASGGYVFTLVSVSDGICTQTQTGSVTVIVQGKPEISLSTQQQTLNEGNTQTMCDTDANPVNSLQFMVSSSCVSGSPVWRAQVGSGAWSDWSINAPISQPSNNQPHRYQAACDPTCPSTYTAIIVLTINYRASIPQNVSLVADGVTVAAGESKDVCNIEGHLLTFNATCAAGEVLLYSVDGGEYNSVIPTQQVDGQYHNYRVRCRRADGIISCVETESGVMRLRIQHLGGTPVANLNVTSGCESSINFSGTASCIGLTTVWYDASTHIALPTLPTQVPTQTKSYYARCTSEGGCMSEKSNIVTYTYTNFSGVPEVTVSASEVCTGTEVTVSTSCPVGSEAFWNTGVTGGSFKVSFANVTRQAYWAYCKHTNGCQSASSTPKSVLWRAFVLTPINIGQSKSAIKANDRNVWSSQFVTEDGGPKLENSTQQNPTLYFTENVNKTAPRYWTIEVEVCGLGTGGSLTFDMLATPETGKIRSFNTHENNAPYFMYANREGYTELYAQNHPAYGFYEDNGAGGNTYDEGLPKGLYKLGVRYWDMKGWGSVYPSTRKPQGNVLAYQEYWFRIQSRDGVGVGAARTAESGQQSAVSEGANGKWQGEKSKWQGARGEGSDNGKQLTDNGAFATVLPNPVTNLLRLQVQESKGKEVKATLLDASGRKLLGRLFVPETNTHQEEFEVGNLASGMYLLQVITPEKQATLKVVKID